MNGISSLDLNNFGPRAIAYLKAAGNGNERAGAAVIEGLNTRDEYVRSQVLQPAQANDQAPETNPWVPVSVREMLRLTGSGQ